MITIFLPSFLNWQPHIFILTPLEPLMLNNVLKDKVLPDCVSQAGIAGNR
jgi:hypothetical protein